MKLESLTLENFKGVKKYELKPCGESMSVYGDNATGKTTLADAAAWLLFDRDSKFTSNFSPMPKSSEGVDVNGVDCSVIGVFSLEDGTEITLQKTYSQVWKAKRGSSEKTFAGHTTSYLVDGVAKSEKEFCSITAEIAKPQDMMILTSPTYFAETMKMRDRRAVLLAMSGCPGDWQIIENTEELSDLKQALRKPRSATQFYSVEEYEKVCKADCKAANAQLKDIPGRIDELTKLLSGEEKTEQELKDIKARLYGEKTRLTLMLNAGVNTQLPGIYEEISQVKKQMLDAQEQEREKISEKNSVIRTEIGKAKERLAEHRANLITAERAVSMHKQEIERLERLREQTIDRLNKASAETIKEETVCPTCGHDIPEEQVEKARAAFNRSKSERLEEIRSYGAANCSKDMIEDERNKMNEARELLADAHEKVLRTESEIRTLEDRITPFEFNPAPWEDKLDMLNVRAQALEKCADDKNSETNKQIADIEKKLEEVEAAAEKVRKDGEIRERIAALEEEEERLGAEFAKAAHGIDLCERFTKAKVSLLTDKINSLFESVKFRLFRTQVNGGIEDDCEVMIPSESGNLVPFTYANNAARINAGLEIIAAYSRFKKISMPIFADNAESVTRLDTQGLQVIRLVVSEIDKTLRTEEF